jgi:hypothetical protein
LVVRLCPVLLVLLVALLKGLLRALLVQEVPPVRLELLVYFPQQALALLEQAERLVYFPQQALAL